MVMVCGMLYLKCHFCHAVWISVGVNVKHDSYETHAVVEVKCIKKTFISRVEMIK
jgi:hypothetical protein